MTKEILMDLCWQINPNFEIPDTEKKYRIVANSVYYKKLYNLFVGEMNKVNLLIENDNLKDIDFSDKLKYKITQIFISGFGWLMLEESEEKVFIIQAI